MPSLALWQRSLLALRQGVPDVAWHDAENLHLTLRFVSEVDEPQAEDLDGELGRISTPGLERRYELISQHDP